MVALEVMNVREIEKTTTEGHGPTALYQGILGASGPKPDLTELLSLWVMTIKPGGTNKRHCHEDQEQAYFVLRGRGTVEVGAQKKRARAWDVVYLPPKMPHAFHNDTETDCLVIGIGVKIPKEHDADGS